MPAQTPVPPHGCGASRLSPSQVRRRPLTRLLSCASPALAPLRAPERRRHLPVSLGGSVSNVDIGFPGTSEKECNMYDYFSISPGKPTALYLVAPTQSLCLDH